MRRRKVQKETRQYTCAQCGKRYGRTLEIGKTSRWCSRACRSEMERAARGIHIRPLSQSMEPDQWMKLRRRVYAKSNGHCHYCGKRLDGIFRVDHVVSVKRGGTHDFENLVPACVSCNIRKGNMLVGDFLAIIQGEEKQRLAAEEVRAASLAARKKLQESFWFN